MVVVINGKEELNYSKDITLSSCANKNATIRLNGLGKDREMDDFLLLLI